MLGKIGLGFLTSGGNPNNPDDPRNKLKKILQILSIGGFFSSILSLVVIVIIVMGPLIALVVGVTELFDGVADFFGGWDKTPESVEENNFLNRRNFSEAEMEKIAKKEKDLQDKIAKTYDEYKPYVKLDVTLLVATISYPLTNIYEAADWQEGNECVDANGNPIQCELDADGTEKYYTKNIKRVEDLAKSMIKKTMIITECIVVDAIKDPNTNEVIKHYELGASRTEEYTGNDFPSNSSCEESGEHITYTFTLDYEKYDKYLKEKYLNDANIAKVYGIPKNFNSEEEKTRYLDNVVRKIHDYAGLGKDYFYGRSASNFSSIGSLCPGGVTVTADVGETNVDTGTFSLEEYVAGVIEHENPFQDPNDPDNIEAMKAQAVAARTYVIVKTNHCKKSIINSQKTQTFYKSYGERSKRATEETAGQVLTYNGEIFLSEYDSLDCKINPAADELRTPKLVCDKYEKGGTCTCEYLQQPYIDSSGNITQDESYAVKHQIEILYDYALPSIGGHGRGMSQLGSRYRQTLGEDYKEILKYYYLPGVEVTTFIGGEGMDGMVLYQSGATLKDAKFIVPTITAPIGRDIYEGKDKNGNNVCGTYPIGTIYSGMDGTAGSATDADQMNVFFWNNHLKPLLDAAKAAGYTVTLTDGWRSFAGQCKVYNETDYTAIPGNSRHGWGVAADLNYLGVSAAVTWIHQNAANYGLHFPMSYENWHIEPINLEYKDFSSYAGYR